MTTIDAGTVVATAIAAASGADLIDCSVLIGSHAVLRAAGSLHPTNRYAILAKTLTSIMVAAGGLCAARKMIQSTHTYSATVLELLFFVRSAWITFEIVTESAFDLITTRVSEFMASTETTADDIRTFGRELLSTIERQMSKIEQIADVDAIEAIAPNRTKATPPPPNSVESIGSECAICTEELNLIQPHRVLPCRHGFCTPCIDKWLLDHSATCPKCRVNVGLDEHRQPPQMRIGNLTVRYDEPTDQ